MKAGRQLRLRPGRVRQTGRRHALLTFGDQSSYHSLLDNVANLDPGSLQAHGDNGAALVRCFANVDLAQAASQPDRVFFNLLPGVVI